MFIRILIASLAVAVLPMIANAQTAVPKDHFRAMRIIKSPVTGSDGGAVGHVVDILVHSNGTTTAFVLAVGGFLGMGVRIVAVPYKEFTMEGLKITVARTKADLYVHPEFDRHATQK